MESPQHQPGFLTSVYQQPDPAVRALRRGWLASVYQDTEQTTKPVAAASAAAHYLFTQREIDEITGSPPGDEPQKVTPSAPPVVAHADGKARRPSSSGAHYLISLDGAEAEHPPARPAIQRRGVRQEESRDVQQEMDALAVGLMEADVEPPQETPTAVCEQKISRPHRESAHYLITPRDVKEAEQYLTGTTSAHSLITRSDVEGATNSHYLITRSEVEEAELRGVGQKGELRTLQREIEDLTASLEELQQDLRKKSGISPSGALPTGTQGSG